MNQVEEKMKTRPQLCPICGNDMKKVAQCDLCAQVYCKECCWRKRCIPSLNDDQPKNSCENCHRKFVRLFNNQVTRCQIQEFYQQKQLLLKLVDTTKNRTEKITQKSSEKQKLLYAYNIKKRNDKIKEKNLLKQIEDEEKKMKQIDEEMRRIVMEKAQKMRKEQEIKMKEQQQRKKLQEQKRKQQQIEIAKKAAEIKRQEQELERKRSQQLEEEMALEAKKKQDELTKSRLREQEQQLKLQKLQLQSRKSQQNSPDKRSDSKDAEPVSPKKDNNNNVANSQKRTEDTDKKDENIECTIFNSDKKQLLQTNLPSDQSSQFNKEQKIEQNKRLRQTESLKMTRSHHSLFKNKDSQPESASISKSLREPFAQGNRLNDIDSTSKPLNPNEMSLNDILNAKIEPIQSPLRLSKRQSVSSQLQVGQSPPHNSSEIFERAEQIQALKKSINEQSSPNDEDIKKSRDSLLRNSSLMSSTQKNNKPVPQHQEEYMMDNSEKCKCEIM